MAWLTDVFRSHPGLLFVAATLLPLLSFVLILLARGLRLAVKPWRDGPMSGLYQVLGGDSEGRGAAYVATGAIGLACVLCLVAFVLFVGTYESTEAAIAEKHKQLHELEHGHGAKETKEEREQKIAGLKSELEELEGRWSGQVTWLRVGKQPQPGEDVRPASTLQLGFRIDYLSAVMFVMVTLVATLIHMFSIGYMSDELQETVEDHQVHTDHGHLHRPGRFGRFFLFLSLFCFSMLNLVLADNLFQVFVSWELVGICSYLLIGFYFERDTASTAANKAFITNRVGDAGFIIGLLVIWTYVGTFNFEELFARIRAPMRDAHDKPVLLAGQFIRANVKEATADGKVLEIAPHDGSEVLLYPDHVHAEDLAPYSGVGPDRGPTTVEVKDGPPDDSFSSIPYWLLVVAGLGIFLGCVGKSAQFPLHVWLPDAMEGPTPVSALIHAATMVAAGVYLVGRVYPLFTLDALMVIAYIGGITMFVAATVAVVMTDIKKVLAYSTVSQLGFMMMALGIGGWVAGLFHLVTHAFFKALLFLGSGSVIYGCHHEQDMSKMGGLYPKMPITALTMLVGVLAIAGTPLFAGWYSKDAIMAAGLAYAWVHPLHGLLLILPLATACLTTFYMFRMWFLTFSGEPKDHHVHEHAHESPWVMTVPLIVLAVCSVFVAWGLPPWNAENSALEHLIHHAQPPAVMADWGVVVELGEDQLWQGGPAKDYMLSERRWAHELHNVAGLLTLGVVVIGFLFAGMLYWPRLRVLDPEEARQQFPAVHRFLTHKWYFDELYSVLFVRPALVVAGWCRLFDSKVLDGEREVERQPVYVGIVNWFGRFWAWVSWATGKIDLGIVDGLVNLTADVIYAVGARLRRVQTGYIRSYVLFLVLAAVGIFLFLSYLVRMAMAG